MPKHEGQLIIIINHNIWSERKFDDVLSLSNQFLSVEVTSLGANLEINFIEKVKEKAG